jgi:hypothetical protein
MTNNIEKVNVSVGNDYVLDQVSFDMANIVKLAVTMREELVKAMQKGRETDGWLEDSVCEIMDDYLPAIMSDAMHANQEHQGFMRSHSSC